MVENEFAADKTLEAYPAHEREKLLVERAVEGRDRHHIVRKTPTTFPST